MFVVRDPFLQAPGAAPNPYRGALVREGVAGQRPRTSDVLDDPAAPDDIPDRLRDNIDEMIKLIRGAKDPNAAREALMERDWAAKDMAAMVTLIDDPRHRMLPDGTARLSLEQARAILDLRLRAPGIGLRHEGLARCLPHHQPNSHSGRRRVLTVTLCGDHRGLVPMHRVSVAGRCVHSSWATL